MNDLLESALERANSRAAVLQSLSSSHQQRLSKAAEEIQPEPGIANDSQQAANSTEAIKLLQEVLGDITEKTRSFFSDALVGKTIVVESAKNQLNAARAENQIQAYV
jgi:hypothetical protein